MYLMPSLWLMVAIYTIAAFAKIVWIKAGNKSSSICK